MVKEVSYRNGLMAGDDFTTARAVLQQRTQKRKRWLYGAVAVAATVWLGLIGGWLLQGVLPLTATGFEALAAWSLAASPLLLLALVCAVSLRQLQSQEQSGLLPCSSIF